jgi:lipoprotein-anchoring transpeptidase ErfK/SrfK
VLGWAPVDLDVKDGNPAKARVTFDTTRMRAGSLAVTFVASTSHRVSITRTIVVTVRPRATRLSGAARTRWAFVLEEARARSAPHRTARVVMTLPTATPDQTPNLVVVLAKQAVKGRVWVKVRLASLPNSRTAWVPRATLSTFRVVRTRLVVDTERMRIALYSRGARIFEAAIGVGRDSAPTPRGTFYVRERLTDFRNPFYGPVAFGTSARSTTLTDWPGGGFVGIHGTNSPGLIPGRISHGCIRLRNDDIIRLAKLLPLGTPVTVR